MLLVSGAHAGKNFEAFPNGSAARYHIDFTRIFASSDAEKAGRADLLRDVEALQAMRGRVTGDGDHLLRAPQMNDAVQVKLARHAIYLYLRYAVDTRDQKCRDEGAALSSEVGARTLERPVLRQSSSA